MLTKSISKQKRSLIRLSLLTGILTLSIGLAAADGKKEISVKKLRLKTENTIPYSEKALAELTVLPNDNIKEEEIEMENWMQDVHDPFWNEITGEDEEYPLESWMSNPAEWKIQEKK